MLPHQVNQLEPIPDDWKKYEKGAPRPASSFTDTGRSILVILVKFGRDHVCHDDVCFFLIFHDFGCEAKMHGHTITLIGSKSMQHNWQYRMKEKTTLTTELQLQLLYSLSTALVKIRHPCIHKLVQFNMQRITCPLPSSCSCCIQ
jgi:hypothetical protein